MELHLLLSIFSPLHHAFGSIMGALYDWLQNYGLVIIVFNLIAKIILMPVNLKMTKNMARQAFLQDDINEIKRVYADDPQTAQQMQMDLMKSQGVSMTGGCLPQIIQLIILIAIYQPIRRPLFFIAGVSMENLTNMAQLFVDKGLMAENAMATVSNTDVNLLAALREHTSVLAESVENGWIQLNQVLDLNFLGVDLGKIPSINPGQIFGAETRATYLPLLILVLLMVATMFLSMHIAKSNQVNYRSKEEIARDKKNPAKQGQAQDQAAAMGKSMSIMMPLMMLWMAFTMPAAMALYWMTTNIVSIIQALLANYYYVQPAKALLEARQTEKLIPKRRRKSE